MILYSIWKTVLQRILILLWITKTYITSHLYTTQATCVMNTSCNIFNAFLSLNIRSMLSCCAKFVTCFLTNRLAYSPTKLFFCANLKALKIYRFDIWLLLSYFHYSYERTSTTMVRNKSIVVGYSNLLYNRRTICIMDIIHMNP